MKESNIKNQVSRLTAASADSVIIALYTLFGLGTTNKRIKYQD